MSRGLIVDLFAGGGGASARRLTLRLAREAVHLYVEEQMATTEIAKALGALVSPPPSHQWVNDRLHEAGVIRSRSESSKLRMARTRGRDYVGLAHEVRRLFRLKKWSRNRIATTLQLQHEFVSRCLDPSERLGISEARKRAHWQSDDPKTRERLARRRRVLELFAATHPDGRRRYSYQEIAQIVGVCSRTVWAWLKEDGFTKGASNEETEAA